MTYKMKGFSGFKSPLKKKVDYNKSNDYSKEATKGNVGDKVAKAVIPKDFIDIIPTTKVLKGAKFLYNYLKG